jgi:mono/diheme cytochrome c family protein
MADGERRSLPRRHRRLDPGREIGKLYHRVMTQGRAMIGWASGRRRLTGAVIFLMAGLWPAAARADADGPSRIVRGEYLFAVAGCAGCHTDRQKKGALLAGGAALNTPFGAFYGPNITPHRRFGIGAWSDDDFIKAMRDGVSPSGGHYFPSFPYPSFTRMRDDDLRAIKAYIFTLPPVARPSRPHEVPFPFNLRFLQMFWKWLFFRPGIEPPDAARLVRWNRGAYLVRAVAHCAECHTPRNRLGGLDQTMWLAGTPDGPEGETVPNITPDRKTGIGGWSIDDITTYLSSGIAPDGDFAGSLMADVIEHSTGRLSEADLLAIAEYLLAVPPIRRKVAAKPGG